MLFTFKDKASWAKQCALKGAVNHIAEVNTYDDMGQEHMLEYAVGKGNSGLYGTWHPIKKTGVVYQKPLPSFSTKNRKFVQEKLKAYENKTT